MVNNSSLGENLDGRGRGTQTKTPDSLYPVVTTLQILICMENLLVIVLVIWSTKLRKLQNAFLANMAVADFLYGCVALTLMFSEFRFQLVWQSGYFVCVMVVSFPHGILMASSISVLCASLDRTIALVSPFRYECIVTKGRVLLAISFTWIIALISVFWPLLLPATIDLSPKSQNICDRRKYIVSSLIIAQTSLLICASGSLTLHLYISRIARRHRKAISVAVPTQQASKKSVLAISKASKILLIITLICLFIWTPNILIEFYHYTKPSLYKQWFKASQAGLTCLQMLPAIVSLLNPWLYTLRNKDFHAALKQLIKPCLCNMKVAPIKQSESLTTPRMTPVD